ncbi:DUF3068 domain-containing protein, partial [Bacteroides fragilis]|nr:DUF3068 domain-containing protein [Bacteroides fragilis]
QRSYPYFDPMTQTTAPIDFTGTEKRETIPTYIFHQEIEPVALAYSLGILQQQTPDEKATAQLPVFRSDDADHSAHRLHRYRKARDNSDLHL